MAILLSPTLAFAGWVASSIIDTERELKITLTNDDVFDVKYNSVDSDHLTHWFISWGNDGFITLEGGGDIASTPNDGFMQHRTAPDGGFTNNVVFRWDQTALEEIIEGQSEPLSKTLSGGRAHGTRTDQAEVTFFYFKGEDGKFKRQAEITASHLPEIPAGSLLPVGLILLAGLFYVRRKLTT